MCCCIKKIHSSSCPVVFWPHSRATFVFFPHPVYGHEDLLVLGRPLTLEQPHLGRHVAHVVRDEGVAPQLVREQLVAELETGEEVGGGAGHQGLRAQAGGDVEDQRRKRGVLRK